MDNVIKFFYQLEKYKLFSIYDDFFEIDVVKLGKIIAPILSLCL
jgi:hypothetical protein